MNTVIKMLFAFLVVFTANTAQAATCYRTANLPPGSPPAVYNQQLGAWCVGDVGQNQQQLQPQYQQYQPQYQQPQQVFVGQRGVTQNGQQCTWRDRAASGVVGAIFGGIVGVLVKDNRRGAAVGAAVGATAGATLFCDPNIVDDNNQVRVQQGGVLQERVVSGGERRMIANSNCEIGEKSYKGLSEADCADIAARLSSRSSRPTQQRSQNDERMDSRQQGYKRSDRVCFYSDEGPSQLPSGCDSKVSFPPERGDMMRSEWIMLVNKQ